MQQPTALFGPLVEVRDVLESFLRDHVVVADWRNRLVQAARQFIEVDDGQPDDVIPSLGRRVADIAASELESETPLIRSVARDVETLMDNVRVPDLPRPEDEDWSF